MCGIAGFLTNIPMSSLPEEQMIDLDILRHRGPDKKDFFQSENVWLGHTRLAILDLSEAGNQPMVSACGNYVMAFNGEIYNHLDLREKFLSDHSFRGHSDSETILELFAKQKEEILQHLVGMWALLIWDKKERKLFVSRDRFGQKPLYIRKSTSGWKFASEMQALGLGKEKFTFNPTAIAEYLSSGNYGHLGTSTFYQEVQQFPLASYAYLKGEDDYLNPKCFWKLSFPRQYRKFGEEEKKQLGILIKEAVLSQTLADVPIGITLSGGIDSSIIAGILAQYYPNKIHIFTAQTPGHAQDETKYVKEVIKLFDPEKILVHYIDLNKVNLSESLHEYLKIQEEPFGDPSITAHGYLMKAAKKAGVKVILGGQGADEIFAGYDHALGAVLNAQIKSLNFKTFFKNTKELKWSKRDWLKFSIAFASNDSEKKIKEMQRVKREEFIDQNWIANKDHVNIASTVDFQHIMEESLFGIHLPHLLHYDDRNAMSQSVEGRTPFLDHRILEYIIQIHPSEYLKDGKRKFLLRESCKEYLPYLIANRKDKIGFFTPLYEMLQNEKNNLSSLFQKSLKSKMKLQLMKDLADLEKVNISLIGILRIYRVYSLLALKEIFPVDFIQTGSLEK